MSLVLMVSLGGIILAGVNGLYLGITDNLWTFILTTWAVLGVIMLGFRLPESWFIRLFNKFTPLPPGTLRTRIEELATAVGFSLKSISVMDASRRSTKLNAFFSGIGRTKEVVLFNTLVEKASEDEILAVLAHELGHER